MSIGGALDASLQYKKGVDFGRLRDKNSKDSKVITWESKFALLLEWQNVRASIVE